MAIGLDMAEVTMTDFWESVSQTNNKPLLIGLIYDFQFIDNSISEEHDIKLDMAFSEQQSKRFS